MCYPVSTKIFPDDTLAVFEIRRLSASFGLLLHTSRAWAASLHNTGV